MSAQNIFPMQNEEGVDFLHEQALRGSCDKEALRIAVGNADLESLTRGNPRIQGGRLLYGGETGNWTLDELPSRCTALDLASQSKHFDTMEYLLSAGANVGGSFEAHLQEKGQTTGPTYVNTWNPTTPLHEIFEQPGGYPGMGDNLDVDWQNLTGAVNYVKSCEHQTHRNDRRVCNFEDCSGCNNTEWGFNWSLPGSLLQNLARYAVYIRDGVRLLLQYGAGRYVNTRVPGRGTPLERFLILASRIMLRHEFLLRHPEIEPVKHDGCPLLYGLADGTHLMKILSETCDLLFDAGARFEGYEQQENVTGVNRLSQVLCRDSGARAVIAEFRAKINRLGT